MVRVKITFLGTGGGRTIRSRCAPAIYVQTTDVNVLLDCGPHTVHQALKHGIPLHKVSHIVFSHLHYDHVLGLPNWILNTWLLPPKELPTLHIPAKTKKVLVSVLRTLPHNFRTQIALTIHEDPVGSPIYLAPDVAMYSAPAKHGDLNVGEVARMIRLETPDGTLTYTGDTAPTPKIAEIAKNADILIHESTHPDSEHKLAHLLGHSTPADAALQAAQANVKQLFVTHISTELPPEIFLRQAKVVYPTIQMAYDFLTIDTQNTIKRA